MVVSNASNDTAGHDGDHYHSEVHGSPYAILFIFAVCAIGAIVRQVMKGWPIPYTVVLIVLGACFGAVSGTFPEVSVYTTMASQDPHLILTTFLPVLLFESAFAMDVHIFYKLFWQIIILAGFGLAIATALTGVMAKMVFTYSWSWFPSLMFGAIISATDPVAVVALLNELGAAKQLGTIIEGESLLNDGMAIVLYKIFFNLSFKSMTATEIGLYFPRVAIGGFFFGLVVGKITVFWLQHVFNDALVEITITLASTYLTFYIGEEVLGISGVLAVVMLGIEINSQKSSISPEVEVFLHRFWEMLAYLANTLIFTMVGVVIMEKSLSSLESNDLFLIVVDYLGIVVIRSLVISFFAPVLMHIGYGFTWQTAVVVSWGGLRGAVGLALALQVYIDHAEIGNKILVHTAGICLITLLVNATTMEKLLDMLGMSEISDSKKIAMTNGVRRIKESNASTLTMLKADRFLADADWAMAEKFCELRNPYVEMDSEGEHDDSGAAALVRHSTCPNCETSVPNEPSPKEFAEMAEDGRVRMIKAQKVSYWKQFEHGMLSRDAVQALNNLADTVSDMPNRIVLAEDLSPFWKVPSYLRKVRAKLESLKQTKDYELDISPDNRFLYFMNKVAMHVMFDAVINFLIIVNMIPIIIELTADDDAPYLGTLEIINYVYCCIYSVEAIWKITAFRINYFKDYWNLLDLFIVILSVIDIILDSVTDNATGDFSPSVLKVFRILRVGRLLRLVKTLLPKLIDFVDNIINRKLSFGYDVGKGYIVAEEEVNKLIEHMVVDKRITRDLKARSDQNRLDVVKSLGMLQRENPGIAISVKTRQAIRTVLNNARDVANELRGGGLLDEAEYSKLESLIETKMKRQLSAPAYIPPQSPESLLRNVVWLEGMDSQVIDSITDMAEMRVFDFGDTITKQGDEVDGIYLIVSGMVKMIGVSVAKRKNTRPSDADVGDMIVTTDYMTAGNLIGEFGLLTGSTRTSSCTCESSVQTYFLPKEKMLKTMETHEELGNRLWRVCGVRIAVPLLMDLLIYHNWTKDKIRLMCERSFLAKLPQPGPNVIFKITGMMQEALLIQGQVTCTDTREVYEGPVILPKAYRNYRLHYEKEPKILIIVRVNENPVAEDVGDTPSALDLLGISKSRYRANSISGSIVSRNRANSTSGSIASSSSIQEMPTKKKRNTIGPANVASLYEGGRRLEPLKEASKGRQITVLQATESKEEVIKHEKHSADI